MTHRSERQPDEPFSADLVRQIINEQVQIMTLQLDLMRAVNEAEGHAPANGYPVRGPGVPLPSDRSEADTSTEISSGESSPKPRTQPHKVPLTAAQRDVWVICQLAPDASAAFNLTATLDLKGDPDYQALAAAVRGLVQRHEALRSTIDADGDHMLVHDSVDIELSVLDLEGLSEHERGSRRTEFIDHELSTPYDLVNGPLFRASILRLGPLENTLVLAVHHLVSDGWSLGVMQRDLSALYSAQVLGTPARLDEAIQFRNFVAWSAEQSVGAEPYWRSLYDAPPAQLDLPTDKIRAPIRAFDYGTVRAVVGQDLLKALHDSAVALGATTFIVLLAAWDTLLHRLSGQSTFASGVYVSGQASMGARSLVGLCTNLLPLRAEIEPDTGLADQVAQLRSSTFDAFDNQHFALGNLAAALQVRRDASRPSVVSTVITLETPTAGIDFEGLQAVESTHGRRRYGSFDFEAYLTERATDLLIDFKFSTALFSTETIERWLDYFVHLLEQMTANPTTPVRQLSLLNPEQRHDLIVRWNDTKSPLPDRQTHELIEAVATRAPDRVAISATRGSLTYAELNARANQLARHLRDLGVGSDRLVGVHLERRPDMVMALLAVHKAGGAYVPLDPHFPAERLAMIVEDAGLHALITERSLSGTLAVEELPIVVIDDNASPFDSGDSGDLGVPVDPSDLAYVIFTSGSTGRPKGVEIPHIALTNLLEAMRQRPGFSEEDVLLAVTTMSFDISALELFLPLTTGGMVMLPDAEEAVDALWLKGRLDSGEATVMQATPATWQLLLDLGWAGNGRLKALCGGEALTRELAQALRPRVGSLWNMYGPTETTIWSAVSEVTRQGPISIGRPIANTELHVLDEALQPQPPGVAGELYIGGTGLARGYRHRPDLTVERFIVHQMEEGEPRRLYRTGDVVRRSDDGEIEYLGRTDHQVKIRGFRIELGEIESVLARHPDVAECVMVAQEGADGSKRLVAYIVPTADHAINVSELRASLRETLPEYMVPALFVSLDEFPLTANRKVDRLALPPPDGQRPDLSTAHVAPRTDSELVLAQIWESLLRVDRIGVEDNFFDLGGDSLLALRSIMRANRAGLSLTPVSIFRHQTIAALAEAADVASRSAEETEEQAIGRAPLTPAQLRFLKERDTPDPHHWNLSALVETETISTAALWTAVDALLRHHDALRIRLTPEGGGWRQEVVAPTAEIPLETHDLSNLDASQRSAAIERICSELQGSLDLSSGPVLRVAHFSCGPDGADRLFVTVHHFAVDGLTWSVLWEDLEQAYRQAVDTQAVSLPPRTTSFRAWALQLEELARTPRVMDTAGTWLSLPWNEILPLPTDLDADRRCNTNDSASAISVELGHEDTRRLLEGSVRPEHVIIAALARCLNAWTASPTVLIDVLSHGRDATLDGTNLSRTVAFTLSYNPVVLTHSTWAVGPDLLDAVTEQIGQSPEGFSFELLRYLAPDLELREALAALPRADLLFNYAGEEAHLDDTSWTTATEPSGPEESPRGLRQHPIAVRATLTPNLRLTFVYSTELHQQSTIKVRAAEVAATIQELLEQPEL